MKRGAAGLVIAGGAGLGAAIAVAIAVAVLGAGACDTVDLGPPPRDVNACRPSQQFFIDEIWPNVLAANYGGKHCYDASCHDVASGRRPTLVVPMGPGTIPLPADWAANYRAASEQMNCTNPTASGLLQPTLTRHGGGMLFQPAGPEVLKIQMWVTAQP